MDVWMSGRSDVHCRACVLSREAWRMSSKRISAERCRDRARVAESARSTRPGLGDELGPERAVADAQQVEPDRGRMVLVDQGVGGEPGAHHPELDRCVRKRVEPTTEDRKHDAGRLVIGPRENRTNRTRSRETGRKATTSSTRSRSGGTPARSRCASIDVWTSERLGVQTSRPGVSIERRSLADVLAEDLGGAVARLRLDCPPGAASERSVGDESGLERMAPRRARSSPSAGAWRSRISASEVSPVRGPEFDRGDGTRAGPTAEDQRLDAGHFLSGLREPDEEHEAAGDGALSGDVERHEFEAAERATAQTSRECINV